MFETMTEIYLEKKRKEKFEILFVDEDGEVFTENAKDIQEVEIYIKYHELIGHKLYRLSSNL